jgi:hypothetical protein
VTYSSLTLGRSCNAFTSRRWQQRGGAIEPMLPAALRNSCGATCCRLAGFGGAQLWAQAGHQSSRGIDKLHGTVPLTKALVCMLCMWARSCVSRTTP